MFIYFTHTAESKWTTCLFTTLSNDDKMKHKSTLANKKSYSLHFSPSKSFALITATSHTIAVWTMTCIHDREERRTITEIGICQEMQNTGSVWDRAARLVQSTSYWIKDFVSQWLFSSWSKSSTPCRATLCLTHSWDELQSQDWDPGPLVMLLIELAMTTSSTWVKQHQSVTQVTANTNTGFTSTKLMMKDQSRVKTAFNHPRLAIYSVSLSVSLSH